jgi:hypothetical protein
MVMVASSFGWLVAPPCGTTNDALLPSIILVLAPQNGHSFGCPAVFTYPTHMHTILATYLILLWRIIIVIAVEPLPQNTVLQIYKSSHVAGRLCHSAGW